MNNPIFYGLLYIVSILTSTYLAYNSLQRPIEKWAKKVFMMLPIFAVLMSSAGYLLIIYEPILKCNQMLQLSQIRSFSTGLLVATTLLLYISGQIKATNKSKEEKNK